MVGPLAQGEGGGPVGAAPGGDGGRLQLVQLPLLRPQAQQLPEPLVLLAVGLPLPGGGLQLGDLGLLRLVQRHHAVERADSCRNAVFLQIVVTQLAEVGGMANAPNRARTALRASRTFRNR